ncbi:MAG: hypothetical protein WD847_20820 [Pirellulales bacterium]
MPGNASRGFPLTTVFLLVTTAAVILALAGAARQRMGGHNPEDVAAICFVGFIVGGIVGFFSGSSEPRRGPFNLATSMAGALTGTACAFVLLLGASFWLFLGGGALLVLLGALAGRTRRANDPELRKEATTSDSDL